MAFKNYIRYPHAQAVALTPRQVAAAYHFPLSTATGKGYVGGIIELGGGYLASQVAQYFSAVGMPMPNFVSVPVAGGTNKQDGPNGADGEVQLDMIVAGAVAPGATYRVYFAENTDSGFLAALKQAVAECNGVSISWGGAESTWDGVTMDAYEKVIQGARAKGVPVFCASGDSGSTDSTSTNQTDFPASAPSAIGCGGTRLTLSGAERATEVTWDDNDTQSATGGGVSKHFPGRDVPDIAGNADPYSGYQIMVDGQSMVVGGTSAVAPLMLAMHALLWEKVGKPFDLLNLILTNPQSCYDVTAGGNGGFRAGPGRDRVTGFGVPDAGLLLAALTSGIPAPVPPDPTPPPPTPPPPSTGDPTSDFPVAAVDAWFQHKHNYSHAESAAASAISAWATKHGVSLVKS